jgi:nicotinic acid mononucleotide adenylyltransferase
MSRRQNVVGAYLISCSAESERRLGQLYIWGQIGAAEWLASSYREARMRVEACKKRTGCAACDFEIHRIVIERTKDTLLQARRKEEQQRLKCE